MCYSTEIASQGYHLSGMTISHIEMSLGVVYGVFKRLGSLCNFPNFLFSRAHFALSFGRNKSTMPEQPANIFCHRSSQLTALALLAWRCGSNFCLSSSFLFSYVNLRAKSRQEVWFLVEHFNHICLKARRAEWDQRQQQQQQQQQRRPNSSLHYEKMRKMKAAAAALPPSVSERINLSWIVASPKFLLSRQLLGNFFVLKSNKSKLMLSLKRKSYFWASHFSSGKEWAGKLYKYKIIRIQVIFFFFENVEAVVQSGRFSCDPNIRRGL